MWNLATHILGEYVVFFSGEVLMFSHIVDMRQVSKPGFVRTALNPSQLAHSLRSKLSVIGGNLRFVELRTS